MNLQDGLQALSILQTLIMGLAAVVGVIVLRSFQAGKFVQANEARSQRIRQQFEDANDRMSRLTGIVQQLMTDVQVSKAVQAEMRNELDRLWQRVDRERRG